MSGKLAPSSWSFHMAARRVVRSTWWAMCRVVVRSTWWGESVAVAAPVVVAC